MSFASNLLNGRKGMFQMTVAMILIICKKQDIVQLTIFYP